MILSTGNSDIEVFFLLDCTLDSNSAKFVDVGNSLTRAIYEHLLTVEVLFYCFDRDNWPFKHFGTWQYTRTILGKVIDIENIDDIKRDRWVR